ncbi:uncharacterized protein [Temnothorax nylanderi]|uniref:uncharacterized protein n=1 Tax=Temnothorax nylanderi TaxID=102681 RepID=UPI003A88C553
MRHRRRTTERRRRPGEHQVTPKQPWDQCSVSNSAVAHRLDRVRRRSECWTNVWSRIVARRISSWDLIYFALDREILDSGSVSVLCNGWRGGQGGEGSLTIPF